MSDPRLLDVDELQRILRSIKRPVDVLLMSGHVYAQAAQLADLRAKLQRVDDKGSEIAALTSQLAVSQSEIERLRAALAAIDNDPIFDSDTQRLIRAHKIARAALDKP